MSVKEIICPSCNATNRIFDTTLLDGATGKVRRVNCQKCMALMDIHAEVKYIATRVEPSLIEMREYINNILKRDVSAQVSTSDILKLMTTYEIGLDGEIDDNNEEYYIAYTYVERKYISVTHADPTMAVMMLVYETVKVEE